MVIHWFVLCVLAQVVTLLAMVARVKVVDESSSTTPSSFLTIEADNKSEKYHRFSFSSSKRIEVGKKVAKNEHRVVVHIEIVNVVP